MYLFPLNGALAEFQIEPEHRCAAFLAQIGHESLDLTLWHEIWGPTAAQSGYEGRADLGNTETGDGFLFRGRGPIQLTGRSNYDRYGALLGVNLIAEPELVAAPVVGFRVAGLFWQTHDLNRLADLQTSDAFLRITKRINGGYTGLADRLKRWRTARIALGLAPVSEDPI